MQDAALHYTKSAEHTWSENVGLYVECYPYCKVPSLHVHVIDLDRTGPGFPWAVNKCKGNRF